MLAYAGTFPADEARSFLRRLDSKNDGLSDDVGEDEEQYWLQLMVWHSRATSQHTVINSAVNLRIYVHVYACFINNSISVSETTDMKKYVRIASCHVTVCIRL